METHCWHGLKADIGNGFFAASKDDGRGRGRVAYARGECDRVSNVQWRRRRLPQHYRIAGGIHMSSALVLCVPGFGGHSHQISARWQVSKMVEALVVGRCRAAR